MVVGANGHLGVCAAKPVEVESKPEVTCATNLDLILKDFLAVEAAQMRPSAIQTCVMQQVRDKRGETHHFINYIFIEKINAIIDIMLILVVSEPGLQ